MAVEECKVEKLELKTEKRELKVEIIQTEKDLQDYKNHCDKQLDFNREQLKKFESQCDAVCHMKTSELNEKLQIQLKENKELTEKLLKMEAEVNEKNQISSELEKEPLIAA